MSPEAIRYQLVAIGKEIARLLKEAAALEMQLIMHNRRHK
jgi:hypothetical protein